MQHKHTPEMVRRVFAGYSSQLAQRAMLRLANTGGTDFARFRKDFPIFHLGDGDDARLCKYRDELRLVWRLTLGCGRILDDWTRRHPVSPKAWFIPMWVVGPDFVEPNPAHLGLMLAMGVRDNADKLGYCPNPDCTDPFFLKVRKNQKVCVSQACIKFAQQQQKRRWWKDEGPQWRAKHRTNKHNEGRKGHRR
jgi:hypothetical protein